MDVLTELAAREFLNNTGQQWLIAFGVAVGTLAILYLLKRLVLSRARVFAQRSETPWDDAIVDLLAGTKPLVVLAFAVFLASYALSLGPRVRTVVTSVAMIGLILQAGLWANRLILFWLRRGAEVRRREDPASVSTVFAVGWVSRLVLWSVVLLLILDNLGIDVTALVAGLGVGGIAVALAVQNVLGDLFASLAIVLDKPFVVGDFLIIGEFLGSVEHIGLKTTRIRSLSGEQLVFSNADLLASRIRNYGRMFERRVVFKLGVTYQTPREKLIRIPAMIRESIERQERTRFDRSHFQAYGDFSLDFETVYYILEPDYNVYMDTQQAILLGIHERFEAEGIEFAYPTQTVFVERAGVPATV